jgi:hypothetical protein
MVNKAMYNNRSHEVCQEEESTNKGPGMSLTNQGSEPDAECWGMTDADQPRSFAAAVLVMVCALSMVIAAV